MVRVAFPQEAQQLFQPIVYIFPFFAGGTAVICPVSALGGGKLFLVGNIDPGAKAERGQKISGISRSGAQN